MKLAVFLGLFALTYAHPNGLDQPCDPSVTHCPRQEYEQNPRSVCGK